MDTDHPERTHSQALADAHALARQAAAAVAAAANTAPHRYRAAELGAVHSALADAQRELQRLRA